MIHYAHSTSRTSDRTAAHDAWERSQTKISNVLQREKSVLYEFLNENLKFKIYVTKETATKTDPNMFHKLWRRQSAGDPSSPFVGLHHCCFTSRWRHYDRNVSVKRLFGRLVCRELIKMGK